MIHDGEKKTVTVIGGGTGAPMLIGGFVHGLQAGKFSGFLPYSVTTMGDHGGDSGDLRDTHGILPPGDFRRTTLAHHEDNGDDTLRGAFNFRFPEDSPFAGKSGGNHIFLILEKAFGRMEAIRRFPRMFSHMHGFPYPVSVEDYDLQAELSDGSVLANESEIDNRSPEDSRTIKKVWLTPPPRGYGLAMETIARSDLVIFAPGDLYSSLMQILLVDLVAEALHESKSVIYCIPIMTKPAETRGFTAADFAETLFKYDIGRDVLDAVVVNTKPVPRKLRMRYEAEDMSEPVAYNAQVKKHLGHYAKRVIVGNYLDREGISQSLIRHDPLAITSSILSEMAISKSS